ncbi:MAG TPA: sulfate ABC transporter permease subunit [Blastocatellia bacterium]|nr:sulfate ABC transporter permease subunit [Blastocatellia bacterium]
MQQVDSLMHFKTEVTQSEASTSSPRALMFGGDATARKRQPRSRITDWTLILVAVLYAAGLLIAPLVAILWGSLAEGASAFVREVASPDALSSFKLTMIMAVGATVINTVFGLCIAWALVRDKFWGRRLLNGLVDMPFAVSPVIAGFMLILLFGRAGWLTNVIEKLGIKVVFAMPGILLATVFISLPFVIREVAPVLSQVSSDQESAAHTIGASGWQTFWHVTLPAIRWGLLYGVSLTFARAVGEIGAVLVVSGGVSGLTETSTLFIFRSLDDRNYVAANAMSIVLAAVSFLILIVIEFFKKRAEEH